MMKRQLEVSDNVWVFVREEVEIDKLGITFILNSYFYSKYIEYFSFNHINIFVEQYRYEATSNK